MPSKQEPRLMLLAALIRGSCTKCRIPIVIVRIFIYYYYYFSAVKRNVQPKP